MKKICPECKCEYETDNLDSKICYSCYQKITNRRQIEANEIVFDVDNREIGFEAINFIGINLYNAGYNFEIWYAEGQKSPHLHIKNIPHLDELNQEQLKKYKEFFIKKYTPKEYLRFVDLALCSSHLIAEENKPHYKYRTIKKLCGVFNEDKINFCDREIYDKFVSEDENIQYKPVVDGAGVTSKIIQKISIIKLAKEFGIEVNSRGFALCPFHADGNPSLKFYENQGRFFCFGCRETGNIIYFYALMKKLKRGEK